VTRRVRAVLAGGESGLTLIEMLVAASMSVILVGAASMMLISAVRTQPNISERSQDITTARWALERMTREIRNGIGIDTATASTVSFEAWVRRASCGSGEALAPEERAIRCQVTYTCTATACSRLEAAPGVESGTPTQLFAGIGDAEVFTYEPNEDPTFVGVTLRFPDPDGSGTTTIGDGASLRGGAPLAQ